MIYYTFILKLLFQLIQQIEYVMRRSAQFDTNETLQRTQRKSRISKSDRFVITKQNKNDSSSIKKRDTSQTLDSYENYLSQGMFSSDQTQSIRSFTIHKTTSKSTQNTFQLKLKTLRNDQITPFRKFKVLGWKDNYYTNLLDWSYNNFICAAYQHELCLYNMAIDDQFQSSLYRKYSIGFSGQYITAVKCSPSQTKVALGYSNGAFKIFDYFKQRAIYHGSHHIQRIGAIEWSSDIILTGSKDQYLKSFDPRTKKPNQIPHQIQKVHTQQICGVRQRGRYFSTGGNDNKVNIYDIRKLKVIDSYFHTAAVKAMTWIGDKTLITGGGTADKKIKFWSQNESVYKQVDTGSQVCSLCWSPSTNQIVSCQGFSLNQIIIWNQKGERQFTIHGHSSRVLYSALSPNGQYFASGAGDQFLKVWKLFPNYKTQQILMNQQLR